MLTDRRPLLAIALAVTLLTGTEAFAHSNAELCDRRQDIAAQCAEAHDCITRPEVSEFIGYCKGELETIMFSMCDQRKGDGDCATGDACKIGTIDPNIGVCVTDTFTDPSPPPPGEIDDHEEDSATCQVSAPTHRGAPLTYPWLIILGALGLFSLSRPHRDTP